MRRFRLVWVLAFVVAACSGAAVTDSSTTTTVGGSGTTSGGAVATTTTQDSGNGQVVGIGDLPQECLDAFVAFLKDIESVVEPIDWANATSADLEAISEQISPTSDAYAAEIAGGNCDDVELDATDEEAFNFMVDVAKREAPGAVGYMEWIRDFALSFGNGGSTASGDCETDIAAFQAIVDQGGTMSNLPVSDLTAVTGLLTSISTACSPERSAEFFSQPDVAAFTSG